MGKSPFPAYIETQIIENTIKKNISPLLMAFSTNGELKKKPFQEVVRLQCCQLLHIVLL